MSSKIEKLEDLIQEADVGFISIQYTHMSDSNCIFLEFNYVQDKKCYLLKFRVKKEYFSTINIYRTMQIKQILYFSQLEKIEYSFDLKK